MSPARPVKKTAKRVAKPKKAAKWGSGYWSDLGERVGSTLLYGLITMFTTINVTSLSLEQAWPIVGLPTVLCLLKGLAANLKDSESGASFLNAPPGPEIVDK